MRVDLFDFELPPERIALRPARPRDSARLLLVDGDELCDRHMLDLPGLLRPGDVLLVSHDGDFLPQVEALLDGTRKVGVLCFREYLSNGYEPLLAKGLTIHDLEDDVRAFTSALPRVRIIDLADFDPTRYL